MDVSYTYHFSEKAELYPARKIYKVGDTIYLTFIRRDHWLYDTVSKRNVLADNTGFSIWINLISSNYNSQQPPTATGLCDILTFNSGANNVYQRRNEEGVSESIGCNSANTFDFKAAIVLKQPGVFCLRMAGGSFGGCNYRASPFPLSDITLKYDLTDLNEDVYLGLPDNVQSIFGGPSTFNGGSFIFNVET